MMSKYLVLAENGGPVFVHSLSIVCPGNPKWVVGGPWAVGRGPWPTYKFGQSLDNLWTWTKSGHT